MMELGVRYVGPILDNSGYARAARENIMALYKLGVPLTVKPLSFENARPDLGECGEVLKELINKPLDYKNVILHCTPEFWPQHREDGCVNIGYTIWETTKLHPDWPPYINQNVDACMVGCEWNVEVFKDSGVTVPLYSVPHCINQEAYSGITPFSVAGVNDDTLMYYSIFQWCYDEKTRVLTRGGFKYFKDLVYDDEIATLNLGTEALEYQKPEKIVKFYRDDKMLSLKSLQFDICVTPEHKMVVREDNGNTECKQGWKLLPFNKILSVGKDGRIMIPCKYKAKKNCKWEDGKEEDFFTISEQGVVDFNSSGESVCRVRMDVFLEFLGWYLSEGCTYKGTRNYVTTISQTKNKAYIKEIYTCVENMGFRPIHHNDKDIIFNSKAMYYYLRQFGKAHEKFIPLWVKNLSSRQIMILLNSLFKGDGSLYENGDFVKYTTTSKQLAEDVQECLLKVGMSGAVSVSDPVSKKAGFIDGRAIVGKRIQYTVSVNRQCNEPSMYYADLNEVQYKGFVYCATVPNHAMLVERNGKVIFSGNTERKHPMALIKAYWYAFQNDENVALVLKTYRSDYSEAEKNAVRTSIKRLKQFMPMTKYPPIFLISDMLSENEIYGLHKRGDCYVSLDRGEGFGLAPFAAGACGNPIIVTGFGGVTEYAKPDNSYLAKFQITPVSGMPWSPWYLGNQLWAEPDVVHAAELMRHVYHNREEASARGKKLQQYIFDNFSYEVIGKKLVNVIEETLCKKGL